jgi:hypothetical protein
MCHTWSIIPVNLSSSNGVGRTWNAKHYSVIFASITTLAASVQFTNPLSGEIRAEKINWARTVTAVCASGALAHTSREWTESRNLITASPHAWHTRSFARARSYTFPPKSAGGVYANHARPSVILISSCARAGPPRHYMYRVVIIIHVSTNL